MYNLAIVYCNAILVYKDVWNSIVYNAILVYKDSLLLIMLWLFINMYGIVALIYMIVYKGIRVLKLWQKKFPLKLINGIFKLVGLLIV
jgi:hypothetical protein